MMTLHGCLTLVCLHDCANICKCYLPIKGINVYVPLELASINASVWFLRKSKCLLNKNKSKKNRRIGLFVRPFIQFQFQLKMKWKFGYETKACSTKECIAKKRAEKKDMGRRKEVENSNVYFKWEKALQKNMPINSSIKVNVFTFGFYIGIHRLMQYHQLK